VEAAWAILRSKRDDIEPLRRWAQRVALRRGTKAAIVALARKLAGILFAMWRDGTTYEKREGRPVTDLATA
jgi:transposase